MAHTPKSVNPITGVKGLDIVLKNLDKEIKAMENRSMTGLIKAAAFIRNDMDKTPPLIPIGRTGNLRGSWTSWPYRDEKTFGIVIGFTANYAVFVHEMVDDAEKRINWSRPNSGPKFFQSALERNHDPILKIIGDNAQIK